MDLSIVSIVVNIAATIIIAIATGVIAYFAFSSYQVASKIQEQEKTFYERQEMLNQKHQKELSDLYQAIVIATVMGGNGNTGTVQTLINTFKQHYRGSTPIFETKVNEP